jgi:3-oxoadipate CoA-transferase, alpha subunit
MRDLPAKAGTHTLRLCDAGCISRLGNKRPSNNHRWLWVPAFAGTTAVCYAHHGCNFMPFIPLGLVVYFTTSREEFFGVINKQVKTTADAVAGVKDGSTVLVAGFGAVGVADHLLDALHAQGAKELTIVANNSGNGDVGIARLINAGRVRKVICSYPRSGDYSAFLKAYRAKTLELELVPQGTISERMRCAAAGLGGFFSPVSAHTRLAEGKETREIDGRLHVFEKPLKGDVALIKANKADRWGNLTYLRSARNFNPVMAMAAELTVVEVDTMVELGEMDPEAVVTPSIFVDRVVVVGAHA